MIFSRVFCGILITYLQLPLSRCPIAVTVHEGLVTSFHLKGKNRVEPVGHVILFQTSKNVSEVELHTEPMWKYTRLLKIKPLNHPRRLG